MNTIILIMMLVTGPGEPDLTRTAEMTSLDECWAEAKHFVDRGIPAKFKGRVLAITAGCKLNLGKEL